MAIRTIPTTYHGGHQTTITRIVIHATVSPCEPGGAQAVAHYFQRARTGSAHYVVDPREIVRCVPEDIVAYHAPPNTGTIGVELCDPQSGPASRWGDRPHRDMLARAATLVADIAHRHGVPAHRLTVADLKAGGRGICGHADVSQAFHQSDHTDPGHGFPWDAFMAAVKGDNVDVNDVWHKARIKLDKGEPDEREISPAAHLQHLEHEQDKLAAGLKAAMDTLADMAPKIQALYDRVTGE